MADHTRRQRDSERRRTSIGLTALACALVAALWLPASRPAQATQTITEPQHGITITYPDGWTAGTGSGGIGMLNYNEEEHPGPLPPEGGAIIHINVKPSVAHLDTILHQQAGGPWKSNVRTSTPGSGVHRVDYDAPIGAQAFHETFVGVVRGGLAVLVTLEYNADDPQGASYQQVLMDVINSISVAGPDATPSAPASR